MSQQEESTKPLRSLLFSKVMNQGVKRAVKIRLEVMLEHEQSSLVAWEERCRKLINQTRQLQLERNYLKRISALKIVIWMLSEMGDRGDLPPLVIARKKDFNP